MFEQALELGQKILAYCHRKGMNAVEIFYSYNNTKQVSINGKSIDKQLSKEELGAGIRVIHNGAEGFSYTNVLTEDTLRKTANEAFSVAKLSPKIEGIGLPSKQKYKQLTGIYNKTLASLDIDSIIDDALDFIRGYTSVDSRIQAVLDTLTLSINGTAILNSNGIEIEKKESNYQAGLALVASDNEKSGSFIFKSIFSREHNFDYNSIGKDLGKKAIDNLNQTTVKAFEGSIIFEPDAVINPIGITMSLNVSADWRQRGTSSWKDKLGDKVAKENLQFVDKPYDLAGGAGVSRFDDEGNATKDTAIIKDGILQSFLHNQRTANKENLTPTGNAIRGFNTQQPFTQKPTTIIPNSPWILAGDMTKDEMIAETKKGLIFHDFAGTIRYQNGIFSGVAKGAYLIEKGEIKSPVTGLSISGNVFDLLNNISGIGKEYHLASGWLTTPLIKFEGIKISTQ